MTGTRTPERTVLEDSQLSAREKALLVTDGTLTQLLEAFAGERITVKKLDQRLVKGAPPALAVGEDEAVMSRRILLRGDRRAYLHAESWLVPSRLPPKMQEAMQDTDTPIGELWRAARLETFREILEVRRETNPEVSGLLGDAGMLLARSYLVNTAGRPMSLVIERFPAGLFT